MKHCHLYEDGEYVWNASLICIEHVCLFSVCIMVCRNAKSWTCRFLHSRTFFFLFTHDVHFEGVNVKTVYRFEWIFVCVDKWVIEPCVKQEFYIYSLLS
jgi:hypothetical protein